MGAAGSVPSELPTGTEVSVEADSSHFPSRRENESGIESTVMKEKLATDNASNASSHSSSSRRQKQGNARASKATIPTGPTGGVGELHDEDEDDDHKSATTSYTRVSAHTYGDGIHSALVTRHPTSESLSSNTIALPRGGVYVRTRAGAIQFGIPPDTIKDSIALGLPVPGIFVVPQERFNLELGINVAEIEFPAYFNFFVLNKDVRVLVTKEQEKDIRVAFEETLEGPADEFLYQDVEFGKFVDESEFDARPDLRKEIDYFKEPRNGRVISCDTLIRFSRFDQVGVADLSDLKGSCTGDETKETVSGDTPEYSLIVQDLREEERYRVLENGKEIASVGYDMASYVPSPELLEKQFKDILMLEKDLEAQLDKELEEKSSNSASTTIGDGEVEEIKTDDDGQMGADCKKSSTIPRIDEDLYCLMHTSSFTPPEFGVTMLGNSHGFDPSGTTTGFIIWMYGYGVAVDPPPHCDAYLMMNGVSPRLVTSVILTHCHADHDAGTFQKVLKERRTTLVTTRTIYEHFIRKYSAVSGLKAEFLTRLLDFKEVNIAEPTFLHGGVFEFFYALHALPCIGFKVTCGNKTMSYSADTFNDPDGLDALEQRGIISAARKKKLLDFPWECDLVLHECGVPPIHTPVTTLQRLPDHVKENLYAVHIADKVATEAGLRKARAGFENTIVIHNKPRMHGVAIHTLQLCAQADIFRESDIHQCIHLLEMSSRHRYQAGYKFTGTMGGIFFILAEGVLKVERENKEPMLLRLGDYFGEISAMNGKMEHMKLTAITDVEIIDINKYAFNQFLRSCPDAHRRLRMLEAMRSQGFTAALKSNSVFCHLTFPQKTQLQSLTRKPRLVEKGSKLIGIGDVGDYMYIVCKGEFLITSDPSLDAKSQLSETPHSEEELVDSAIGWNPSTPKPYLSSSYDTLPSGTFSMKASKHTQSYSDSLARSRISKRSSMEVNHKPRVSTLPPGGIFIPANVFRKAVLGEFDNEALDAQKTAMIAQTESSVFEIRMDGFEDFLLRNPGIQLALMKHSSGAVI